MDDASFSDSIYVVGPKGSASSSHSRDPVNLFNLLTQREVASSGKRTSRRCGVGQGWRRRHSASSPATPVADASHRLEEWAELDSFSHYSAQYCSLHPTPRSTIAASFSSDGSLLASTHGDHTLKLTSCPSPLCVGVLSGHRRTPWVVRFHPFLPHILASGSLDHQVRLWNTNTGESFASFDFYRPIASLAFHSSGDFLAVASGHKLYIWRYRKPGDPVSFSSPLLPAPPPSSSPSSSQPHVILRTRRSLRAVHFHPHGAPLLLTAEVNELDSTDYPPTLALTSGIPMYPPPAIHFHHPHHLPLHHHHHHSLPPPASSPFPQDAPAAQPAADPFLQPQLQQPAMATAPPAPAAPFPPSSTHWSPLVWSQLLSTVAGSIQAAAGMHALPETQPLQVDQQHRQQQLQEQQAQAAADTQQQQQQMATPPFQAADAVGIVGPEGRTGGEEGGEGGGGVGAEERGTQSGFTEELAQVDVMQADIRAGGERAEGRNVASSDTVATGSARESLGRGSPSLDASETTEAVRGEGKMVEQMEVEGESHGSRQQAGRERGSGRRGSGGASLASAGSDATVYMSVDEEQEQGEAETAQETGSGSAAAAEPSHRLPASEQQQQQQSQREQMEARAFQLHQQYLARQQQQQQEQQQQQQQQSASGSATGEVLPHREAGSTALPRDTGAAAAAASVVASSGAASVAPASVAQPPAAIASDPQVPIALTAAVPPLSFAPSPSPSSEIPCTVKLRIWKHSEADPLTPLEQPHATSSSSSNSIATAATVATVPASGPARQDEKEPRCLLTLPHAVLCSEMGAHFSPCGRFLAACVACTPPSPLTPSSPSHPSSTRPIIYELRVYSLEHSTFGQVLSARAIRAAHCLTSIQFSPSSSHLLLAYGRRHSSLLHSLVVNGHSMLPMYTILEVYRVTDMALLKAVPSAEDEVNVACFHPSIGGGLVYGTKEGKLRVLHYDRSAKE